MNKAAEDFFANLPSEKDVEGQDFDMFQQAEPEKDTTEEQTEKIEEVSQRNEDALPEWWVAASGDDENSRAGYKNQLRIAEEITNKAIQAREEARLQEEAARAEQVEAIEQSFDEQMDDLEDSLGRELTANQKSELLDIVGEYSPQDADGQYTAFISLEKAYDIWSSKGQSKPEKKMIAEIASTQSSGGAVSTPAERPQWGDWRKRLGG